MRYCYVFILIISFTKIAGGSDLSQSQAVMSSPVVLSLPQVEEGIPAGPEAAGLTFQDLVNTAMACNPTISQAHQKIRSLQGECLQVGLLPNPVIGYAGDEIGDEGKAGMQGMVVAQEIVTAGKLRLNRAVVKKEIDMAHQNLEIQRLRVQNDVIAAAYVVLAAQRTLELTEQLVQIGEKGEAIAQKLFEGKEVSRVDVLQARVEVNTARLNRDNAQTNYQAAWHALTAVMGTPAMQPIALNERLDANITPRDWNQSLARLLSASPELAKAHSNVQRARCELSRQIAGSVPNLELVGGVQKDNATESTITAVGVAAPLQIFNRNQGNIRRARADLAAACREVERIELLLQERLAESFKKFRNAYQQVEMYQRLILPDAKSGLTLTQEGYSQGELGYLELLTSQRTYFQTSLAYVHSLQQLQVTATHLEGLLLTGALSNPDN